MKRTLAIRCRSAGMVMLIAGALLAWCDNACACNVPVFRYALERWQPDPYRAILFHRGDLTEPQRTLLSPLEEGGAGKLSANIVLRLVDVDAMEEEADRTLFESLSSPDLPYLVVQYPQGLRIEKPIWASPLAGDEVAGLVDSPLRKELIRRLADGETAVWVMLECGQAEKDEAVAAQLKDELKKLAQQLELPELTSSPEDSLLSDTPLQVTFSLLRVPRTDRAEGALVAILLESESDLAELNEPMVFPVFGRGRALLPLVGAGITPENIHDSAAFLVGACSCQIKDLNPGFDLLLNADWDALLFKDAPPPEILASREAGAFDEPQYVEIPTGAPPAQSLLGELQPSQDSWFPSNSAAFFTLGGLLLAAVVAVASKGFARRQA